MKIVVRLFAITLTLLLLSCSQKETVATTIYQWHGVVERNPVAPNPKVIYLEIPDKNWVYYSTASKNFFLYTGYDWIVLPKVDARSMVDSLNLYKTNKIRSLL